LCRAWLPGLAYFFWRRLQANAGARLIVHRRLFKS
jgi:hypothetical protein